jgi:NADP-dependent 3-hydroxy acid dehydrogenase YdfG
MTNVNQAEFEGKVAIVTGAASGIGRATTVSDAQQRLFSTHVVLQLSQRISSQKSMSLPATTRASQQS